VEASEAAADLSQQDHIEEDRFSQSAELANAG
jgi:hypothetical protein